MMQGIIKDGIESPNVLVEGQTKDGLRKLFAASWERMEPFLRDSIAINREYQLDFPGGESARYTGHWLVFGQIEHDIHHRADILHYLRELGMEHEEPDAIVRRLRGIVDRALKCAASGLSWPIRLPRAAGTRRYRTS